MNFITRILVIRDLKNMESQLLEDMMDVDTEARLNLRRVRNSRTNSHHVERSTFIYRDEINGNVVDQNGSHNHRNGATVRDNNHFQNCQNGDTTIADINGTREEIVTKNHQNGEDIVEKSISLKKTACSSKEKYSEEEYICQICFNEYDQPSHTPRACAVCRQSCCNDCWVRMILCPFCRPANLIFGHDKRDAQYFSDGRGARFRQK